MYTVPPLTHVLAHTFITGKPYDTMQPIMAGRARLLLRRAEQVVTIAGPNRARIGAEMSKLGIIPHASVVVGADGRIVEVSTDSLAVLTAKHNPEHIVDCVGKTILPGFVDPHTHTVFAGDRRCVSNMRVLTAACARLSQTGTTNHLFSRFILIPHTHTHTTQCAHSHCHGQILAPHSS
jgi:hypothetical protein